MKSLIIMATNILIKVSISIILAGQVLNYLLEQVFQPRLHFMPSHFIIYTEGKKFSNIL